MGKLTFYAYAFFVAFLFAPIALPAQTVIDSSKSLHRPNLEAIGLFANDTLWDGEDRWRTGSYQRSLFIQSGAYEFRYRVQYITPEALTKPDKKHDRPYASDLNLFLGRYNYFGSTVLSYGVGVDFINQLQTMETFHSEIHKALSLEEIALGGYRVPAASQLSLELGMRHDLRTQYGYAIPFFEIELGTRDRITAGFDLLFSARDYFFYSREQTTGHILGVANDKSYYTDPAIDFLIGADISYVASDYYLDNDISNVKSEPFRYRLRTGLHYHYQNATLFLGPTYLSPEFKSQKQGQMLQSISVEVRF